MENNLSRENFEITGFKYEINVVEHMIKITRVFCVFPRGFYSNTTIRTRFCDTADESYFPTLHPKQIVF